ncbi:MAG: Hint domain-containing protein [Rhodobacteraceae bacterium]|nr:MAG: Hint domain-containing protein [Paracoccaceae bacterium]
MGTGFTGTFVISWSQTEVDGAQGVPQGALTVGSTWAWSGDVVRVDGPGTVWRLDRNDGDSDLRRHAARMVRKLVGAALSHRDDPEAIEVDAAPGECSFVVTDGLASFTVTVIETGPATPPLLMFVDAIPPRGRDLWIVHTALRSRRGQARDPAGGGVICFTPGTRIGTPDGPRAIETLREGDRVMTRDNGAKEILWIGSKRMTGARLFVMPDLRPIRFLPGALGIERPDQELLVSPGHRMLVRGAAAQALFNTPEVLVPARELVNDRTVFTDLSVREVTYIHLLLDSHEVIWANGVEAESFHPASAALSALDEDDRDRLLTRLPGIRIDPHGYGDYARRNLSPSEAAILRHEVA